MRRVAALAFTLWAGSAVAASCPTAWRIDSWKPPSWVWERDKIFIPVIVTNTGHELWSPRLSDHLSYHWRDADGYVVSWDGERTELEQPLKPGNSRQVLLRVRTPEKPGRYLLELAMVREQVCWYPQPTGQERLASVRVLPRLPFLVGGFGFVAAVLSFAVAKKRPWGPWLHPLAVVLWLVGYGWVLARMVAIGAKVQGAAGSSGVLWAGACLAVLPLLAVPVRWWSRVAAVLGWLLLALAFADTLSLRFFGSIVSLMAWRGAGQVGQVWDSVRSLMKPEDWWFAVMGLWAFLPLFWPRWKESWSFGKRVLRRVVVAVVSLAASFWVIAAVARFATGPEGEQVFSYTTRIRELGLWGAHLFDVFRAWKEAVGGKLDPRDRERVRAFFAERARTTPPSGPAWGRFAGYNLVLIQVESLQNFVVGLSVAGQEVTPFLNSLRQRGLYFSWVFDQTNQGRSSDGEFIALNSQHALAEGAVVFRRAHNRFLALPRVLQRRGYSTLSAHAFERGFWNRAVLHPKYGFEKSFFQEELGSGEVIGWGLADKVFFQRVVPRLHQARQPFFAFLITLGLHHPFDGFPEGRKKLGLPDLGDPALANYLQSMRYVDEALAQFYEELRGLRLAERTVVAIYGDHEAGFPLQAPLANLLHVQWSWQQVLALRRVPFFIITPDPGLVGEVDEVGGQVDIAPTLLHLLGIPRPPEFVGRALIPGRGGFAALPDGSGVDNERIWMASGPLCASRRTLEKLDLKVCKALEERVAAELAASRTAVLYDLLPEIAGP